MEAKTPVSQSDLRGGGGGETPVSHSDLKGMEAKTPEHYLESCFVLLVQMGVYL